MRLAVFALAVCAFTVTTAAADEAPQGVVELFTSQGCSSCPPADRLAYELSRSGRTLVLTLPVDYWDYLGWKDTLASPANSARQRAYAMARGDRKVYTPQIVVNGREACVGSDGAAVVGAVRRADDAGSGLGLPVNLDIEDGRVTVTVAAPTRPVGPKHAEIWAFAVERSRTVQIGRGENAGKTVTYVNIVRKMTRLGAWDGQPVRFDVAVDEVARPDTDGIAIVVQSGSGGLPGPIVGAASAESSSAALTGQSRLSRDPL